MKTAELIEMIRRSDCVVCPVMKKCETNEAGCILYRIAADRLEELEAKLAATEREKQAIFRLGQMDMRQSAAEALADRADGLYGLVAATMIDAAEFVRQLGVMDE